MSVDFSKSPELFGDNGVDLFLPGKLSPEAEALRTEADAKAKKVLDEITDALDNL